MNQDRYPRSSQEAFGMRSYSEDFEDNHDNKITVGEVAFVIIMVGIGWLLWMK
jgi:hypothetical protein